MTVDKQSAAARSAVAEMNELLGFDMEKVLTPESWVVVMVEGRPEVAIDKAGMRAMALFSPLPNGPEIAEQIIAHLEARQNGGNR